MDASKRVACICVLSKHAPKDRNVLAVAASLEDTRRRTHTNLDLYNVMLDVWSGKDCWACKFLPVCRRRSFQEFFLKNALENRINMTKRKTKSVTAYTTYRSMAPSLHYFLGLCLAELSYLIIILLAAGGVPCSEQTRTWARVAPQRQLLILARTGISNYG